MSDTSGVDPIEDGEAQAPDGTEENPFPTVADALVKIAEAYAVEDGEGAEVKLWPGKGDPAKEKSAEIVLLDEIESGPISIAEKDDTAYPPLILSAQDPVKPNNDGSYSVGDITLADKGSLLTVGAGVTLTLRNITLKGIIGNNASLVSVVDGGRLTLEAGAVITDNKITVANVWGGGVSVSGLGSAFTMNGGTISGNTATNSGAQAGGGGVLVSGGGVAVLAGFDPYALGDSSFEMNGGTISDNTVTENGIGNPGGGVYVSGSGNVFTMNGGTISRNEALAACCASPPGIIKPNK